MKLFPNLDQRKHSALGFMLLFAVVGLIALRLTNAQSLQTVAVSGSVTLCDSRQNPTKPCSPAAYADITGYAVPRTDSPAQTPDRQRTEFTTKTDGGFNVDLLPGTYTVGIIQKENPSSIHCPAQTVIVKENLPQRVTITCTTVSGQVL